MSLSKEYIEEYYKNFAATSRAQSVVVPNFQTRENLVHLDDHQAEAMDSIAERVEQAVASKQQDARFLITHCCGSGKTWLETNLAITSAIAREGLVQNSNSQDILIATERASVLQLEDYCREAGLDVGVWGAGRRMIDRPTIISTIQSLQMNRRNMQRLLGDRIHLLIGDEADLYLTQPRTDTIRQIPALIKAGFTGTPHLPDGRHAVEVWGEVASTLSLREGILREKNVPPYYYLYGVNIDESSFKMRGDDYDPQTIAAALMEVEIRNALPDLYDHLVPIDRRKELPTLMYLPTTDLVRTVKAELQKRNPELVIHYWTGDETSSLQLEQDINAFDNGEIHVLLLCEMGGRSLNFVNARLLFDCYPTQSERKYEQRVARVMRRIWPGSLLYQQGVRKENCTVVQIVPTRRRGSHYFRPVTMPDILGEDTWIDISAGRPLLSSKRGSNGGCSGGAPMQSDIIDLREQIQKQNPHCALRLIQELDVLKELHTRGNLPRADLGGGQFFLGRRYARRSSNS